MTLAPARLQLTSVSEDIYMLLRSSMVERVRDKEAPIRVQAVIALSKLAPSEDISELDDDEPALRMSSSSCWPTTRLRECSLVSLFFTQRAPAPDTRTAVLRFPATHFCVLFRPPSLVDFADPRISLAKSAALRSPTFPSAHTLSHPSSPAPATSTRPSAALYTLPSSSPTASATPALD